MARNIGADGRTVYRATITSTNANGHTSTWHEGPYTSTGAARARVSFWRNYLARTGSSATGHAEQAHTVWTRVDDGQAEPEQYHTDPNGRPTYARADVDGDRLLASVAVIPDQGAGVYFRTDPRGSSITLAELPAFIARLQAIADAARTVTEEPSQ